jgi:hypothetical protein
MEDATWIAHYVRCYTVQVINVRLLICLTLSGCSDRVVGLIYTWISGMLVACAFIQRAAT